MGMPDIVMGRIDNRLLHGQVGVAWSNYLQANTVVIVDDDMANNNAGQTVMSLAAKAYGYQIRFFTVDKAKEILWKASKDQHIFLITKEPFQMLELVKSGLPITKVNVGNIPYAEKKRQIKRFVYVSEEEHLALMEMKNMNVDVFIQDVPTTAKEEYQ